MATVVSGAAAASDLNTVQNFTAGEIVTADDMNMVGYEDHLKEVRRLQSVLSFDGTPRVGIIRGFRAATRNSGAMTITVPGGLGIAKVVTSEVNDSEHYVCFENDDSVVVTLNVGHGTYPRVDLIALRPVEEWAAQTLRSKRNTDGSLTTFNVYPSSGCYADLVYVPGTAAASPTPPALDDANDIPLFYVYVPATVTATNTCTLNPIMPLLHGTPAESAFANFTVTVSEGHIALVATAASTLPDNVVLGAWAETTTDDWALKIYVPIDYYKMGHSWFSGSGAGDDNANFKFSATTTAAAERTGMTQITARLYFDNGAGLVAPSGTQNVKARFDLVNDGDRAF